MISRLGLLAAALIVAAGTVFSFQRGAPDFSVFFAAWEHAWHGEGQRIFSASPDRYLYAPGFAWLLAPLAGLPRPLALGLWNLGKASALGYFVFLAADLFARGSLGTRAPVAREKALAAVCAGILFWARPVLIDFQYGQINLYLLVAAFAALAAWADAGATKHARGWAFFALGLLGATTPILAPLLAIPFLSRRTDGRSATIERSAVIAGALLIFLLPFCFQGIEGGTQLYREWLLALGARGMPNESHNQSFAAFLRHFTSGETTRIISLYRDHIYNVGFILSLEVRNAIVALWALGWLATALTLIVRGARGDGARWSALLLGLLLFPSYLVWKPYFVFAIPVAAALYLRAETGRSKVIWIGAAAVAVFASGDLIGPETAAFLDVACLFLWIALSGWLVLWRSRPRFF